MLTRYYLECRNLLRRQAKPDLFFDNVICYGSCVHKRFCSLYVVFQENDQKLFHGHKKYFKMQTSIKGPYKKWRNMYNDSRRASASCPLWCKCLLQRLILVYCEIKWRPKKFYVFYSFFCYIDIRCTVETTSLTIFVLNVSYVQRFFSAFSRNFHFIMQFDRALTILQKLY